MRIQDIIFYEVPRGRLIKKLKFKRSWEQEKKLLEKIQKIKSLAEKINKSL